VIAGLTRDDAVAFHHAYYEPAHAIITIVGDITPDAAKRAIETALAAWPPGGSPVSFKYPAVPAPAATTIYLADKPGAAQSSFAIGLPGPARIASCATRRAGLVWTPMSGRGEAASIQPARVRDGLAPAAAFDKLFRELYEPLVRSAYRLTGSQPAAEDVVHEVFLAYWNRPADAALAVSPRSYLYRAVRNRALNALRSDRTARTVPLGDADCVAEGALADADGDREREGADALTSALARAVGMLPERARLVFTLSREHGMTYPEIADTLGISVRTVETQISRALVTLRRTLEPHLP
jgi:RNA polymerase sigma-70 factor (family 1)